MSDRLIAEQISYYRRRADEYDATAYDWSAATERRIEGIVATLPPSVPTLELACGTGIWTRVLARITQDLTAIDSSPEAMRIAQQRCRRHVRFICSDVFRWLPDRRYDLVFFAAWLSHVPVDRLGSFFRSLEAVLAEHGQVIFVDEQVSEAPKEQFTADPGVVQRRLSDGSQHRVVKVFIDPPKLIERLDLLGWACEIDLEGRGWVVGKAQPRRS